MDEEKKYGCTDIELCKNYISAVETAERLVNEINSLVVFTEELRNDDRLSWKMQCKIDTANYAMQRFLDEMKEFSK